MGRLNDKTCELAVKLVYYGPSCSGKTRNLQCIQEKLAVKDKHELLSLTTETERTLYFDFLRINMGKISGFYVRFLVYSVPGQVFYDEARKHILMNADGLVFVAEFQKSRLDENIECLENLFDNLKIQNYDPDSVPLVFQYNKQDLAELNTVSELNDALNFGNKAYFSASAKFGTGILETFRHISKEIVHSITKKPAYVSHGEKVD